MEVHSTLLHCSHVGVESRCRIYLLSILGDLKRPSHVIKCLVDVPTLPLLVSCLRSDDTESSVALLIEGPGLRGHLERRRHLLDRLVDIVPADNALELLLDVIAQEMSRGDLLAGKEALRLIGLVVKEHQVLF